MPHITSTLGNEPGIQYNRPNDKTGGTGIAPINNVFVGQFRRGRTDKMLDITKQNIRAVLGFDPKNPDYVAVQDALDTNIASVKVLRIVEGSSCTAVGFVKDPESIPLFPNVILSTNFSVVDWPIQTFNYVPNDPENDSTNYIYKYLNALLEHLKTITVNDVPLVTGGEGGIAYFQKSGYGTLVAASSDEVESLEPVDIKLYANGNQANDPILAIFGQSPMILHSCGYKEWPGF